MKNVRRHKKIINLTIIIGAFILTLAVISPEAALADWKIYYTGIIGQQSGYQGRGSFATQSQCEQYRMSQSAGDISMSSCRGSNTPSSGGGIGFSQQMAAQFAINLIMQGLFSVDDAHEQERKIEQEMQRIKDEKEREIARKKAWESVEKELMRISSAKPNLMSINDEKTACVQGDPTIKRACILNGSPCCPPYVCEGKFPNTYCVFKGSGVADMGPTSSCIKGDSLIMRACVLNGTPCCAPYRCKGKFPNTYCVLE